MEISDYAKVLQDRKRLSDIVIDLQKDYRLLVEKNNYNADKANENLARLKFEEVKSEKLEKENKRYRKVIESMKSEINYVLHSHKSKDVKRHYLENAVRYANEALEESE